MARRLGGAAIILSAALATSASTQAWATDQGAPAMVSQKALSSAPVSADYRISPADQLDVTVFQIGDLSRSVQVDSGGKILLPLVGEITAAGMTTSQLSEQIATALKAKYVRDPMVTVTVRDAATEKVTVDGAVGQPGVYPLAGPTTLMQAIALAKGTDPKRAAEHKVSVYRLVDGKRMGTTYDLAAIRVGRAPDPTVYARDIVVVPESGAKTFWHELVSASPLAMLIH